MNCIISTLKPDSRYAARAHVHQDFHLGLFGAAGAISAREARLGNGKSILRRESTIVLDEGAIAAQPSAKIEVRYSSLITKIF